MSFTEVFEWFCCFKEEQASVARDTKLEARKKCYTIMRNIIRSMVVPQRSDMPQVTRKVIVSKLVTPP